LHDASKQREEEYHYNGPATSNKEVLHMPRSKAIIAKIVTLP
jgi:hypothetical protein